MALKASLASFSAANTKFITSPVAHDYTVQSCEINVDGPSATNAPPKTHLVSLIPPIERGGSKYYLYRGTIPPQRWYFALFCSRRGQRPQSNAMCELVLRALGLQGGSSSGKQSSCTCAFSLHKQHSAVHLQATGDVLRTS